MAGAVPVVDVHHGDSGRAGVQHRQQRGQSFERGSVAHRRRHRDDGRADQAGHHAGQRAVHARDDHDHPGPPQQLEAAEHAVQAGDADVDDQLASPGRGTGPSASPPGRPAGRRCRRRRPPPDRRVGSGGTGARRAVRHRRPTRVRQRGAYGRGMIIVGAGEQGDLGQVADAGGDQPELLRGLAGAVDGLGIAAAGEPVMIKISESRPAGCRRLSHDRRLTSGRVNAPDWIPRQIHGDEPEPGLRVRPAGPGRAAARGPPGPDQLRSARPGPRRRGAGPGGRRDPAGAGRPRPDRSAAASPASPSRSAGSARPGTGRPACRPPGGPGPGDGAYVGLGHSGVGERPEHGVLGRRPAARPVGPRRVIGVLPVRHRVEPVLGQQFGIDRG